MATFAPSRMHDYFLRVFYLLTFKTSL